MTNGNNYEKTFALQIFASHTTRIIISIKELNSRRMVYVEIPKPSRVELNPRGFGIST
jgi:hypothetical protein